MYIDFSALFHRSSKDLRDKGAVNIPQDSSLWPADWSTVYYKTYPRFPKIQLSRGKPKADFFDVVEARSSERDFAGQPTDFEKLSHLLQHACGLTHAAPDGSPARAYASGGARYPIEIYPIVFKGSAEIPAGIYHYGVENHELDVLWQRPFTTDDLSKMFVYEWTYGGSFALVMTAVFRRSQNKYGERGYRYVLLEAGHIGENVYLTAKALGLKCCAITGTYDEYVERLLDIDGVSESVVHSVVLG